MWSIPERWKSRHREALIAWQQDDVERLCEICEPEVDRAARRVSYRCGLTDLFEQLQDFGRKGVEKAARRYDPSKGVPFQAYAWQDIYWETRRGAEAILKMVPGVDEGSGYTEEDYMGEEQSGRSLEAALASLSLKEWRDVIEDLGEENLAYLRSFMDTNRTRLVKELGERRYWSTRLARKVKQHRYWDIRLLIFEKIADNVLSPPGVELKEVSGPQKMEIVERRRKAMGKLPAKVDDRKMGRAFGKDGKTIARWRRDTTEFGVPPTMNEDGSFALKSPEDWEEWFEYSVRIGAPGTWRRLQRRQQVSE